MTMRSMTFTLFCLLGAVGGACDAPHDAAAKLAVGVGDECLQPAALAPEGGYDRSSVFVETGSVQCQTGVCLVYHLRGDPNPETCVVADECNDPETAAACAQARCVEPEQVNDHVYCSCRCDGEDGCACPSGFSCEESLEWDEVESYCVRERTVAD